MLLYQNQPTQALKHVVLFLFSYYVKNITYIFIIEFIEPVLCMSMLYGNELMMIKKRQERKKVMLCLSPKAVKCDSMTSYICIIRQT